MPAAEVYKYNPRLIPADELQATFVARQVILDDILGELRARAAAPANQHFLIIGSRGIGKTNLLLMIRYGVLGDEALAKAYLPLQTAEEEYSVAHLRHLFAKILAMIVEQAPDDEAKAAAQSIQDMQDDDQAAEAAIEASRAYAARTGRKLLLLVDNLDLILGDQLRDDAQIGRLRDLLMNESFLVLIGAAPTYFDEVSGYDRPFYNFFRTVNLQDLSPEQIVQMLRKRAEWDGNRTILDHLDELPPRIKAVHHLTGGNPRLVLMLYQLCTASELPEVRAAVQALLDDVTPYYKSRLEQLPPQQRRLMDTFARLGRPATPAELAAEMRLSQNQTGSILQRLKEAGFVTLAPQERRKKTYYMVSERLFRIWHQMRFSTATSRRIQFLIEFIRVWYTPQEWVRETDRLIGEYSRIAGEQSFAEAGRFLEHVAYMAEAAPTPAARHDVQQRAVHAAIESRDFDHAETMLHEWREVCEREGYGEQLAGAWLLTGYLFHAQGKREEEADACERAVARKPDSAFAIRVLAESLGELARTRRGPEADALFTRAFEKYEAALRIKPDMYEALYNWANDLTFLALRKPLPEADELFLRAFQRYEGALRIKPDMQEALYNWGIALCGLGSKKSGPEALALFARACEKFEAALRIKPDMHKALHDWGGALVELALKRSGPEADSLFASAFEKYEAAIRIKPDLHEALNNWGDALWALARTKSGTQLEALLEAAAAKIAEALRLASSAEANDAAAFYCAHLLSLTLRRCANAVATRNLGQARSLFSQAMVLMQQARQDLAGPPIVWFFEHLATYGTATLYAEFLDAIRARGMDRELPLLEPFVKAAEYWQKGRDAEVLDRLNPEVREIVEEIIRRGEKKDGVG